MKLDAFERCDDLQKQVSLSLSFFLQMQVCPVIGNYYLISNPCPVYTGVPQGSIIGRPFFLIHFNDTYRSLKHTNIVTYADDTVIFTSSSEMDIIESHLNQHVNSPTTWFRKNELIVNLKKGKTEAMLFGTVKRLNKFKERQLNMKVGETSTNCTTQYKYLRVTLDPSLTLDTHLDIICKNTAGRVNLLRRIRNSIDTSAAVVMYDAMIMPLFTHCGSVRLGWPDSKLTGCVVLRNEA